MHSFRVVIGIGLIFNAVALVLIIAGIMVNIRVMYYVFSATMLIAVAFYAYGVFISSRRSRS